MIIEQINSCIDPWQIYKRIYNQPYSFILDSSKDIGEKGRFSFLGWDPFLLVKGKGKRIETIQQGERKEFFGNPLHFLNELLKKFSVITDSSLYLPLQGGAVGYLSYDLKSFIEKLPHNAYDDLKLPDLAWGFYDVVFIYDNLTKEGYIASTGLPESNKPKRKQRAHARFKAFKRLISTPETIIRSHSAGKEIKSEVRLTSNFSRKGYIEAIEKALEYISAGDIYQINLSQRFSFPLVCQPLDLYEKLRAENPVPMGGFFHYGDLHILSNSPERFFKVFSGTIETYPIKGTVKRGRDRKEDIVMMTDLKKNPKELAEHIMIVDLERNDLGKICRYGTVKVNELEKIETYSSLHHMVSRITGRVRDDINIIDTIEALFPGGSITGAPKVRAMEIIDELEPTARGIYTGAIGYIDFTGRADMNISIRTAIASKGKVHYQAGGGIVADSDPEKEYQETLLKAKAFFNAINLDSGNG